MKTGETTTIIAAAQAAVGLRLMKAGEENTGIARFLSGLEAAHDASSAARPSQVKGRQRRAAVSILRRMQRLAAMTLNMQAAEMRAGAPRAARSE